MFFFNCFMVQRVINLLVQVKNFSISKRLILYINKHSKFPNILYALYKNGLIQSFGNSNASKYYINIRYYYNKPVINYLKFFSKPSFSIYLTLTEIYQLPTKKFLFFFSTSTGNIYNQLECKKHKVGGKLLFLL
ncbi:MAG: Ribosomal protein [Bacteroidota bacterium]